MPEPFKPIHQVHNLSTRYMMGPLPGSGRISTISSISISTGMILTDGSMRRRPRCPAVLGPTHCRPWHRTVPCHRATQRVGHLFLVLMEESNLLLVVILGDLFTTTGVSLEETQVGGHPEPHLLTALPLVPRTANPTIRFSATLFALICDGIRKDKVI